MPQRLIEGYQRFRKGYFARNRDRLAAMATAQNPNIAVLSCCDSRVDPATVFDASPGDLFVIRNVANLVPPYEQEGLYHGTSAALEFAVTGLEVSHIVVLGHANCGGIRALMDKKPGEANGSFIDRWMEIAAPVRKTVAADHPNSAESRYTACEHGAITHSLQNLMTYPWVKSRVERRELTLHGWHYDLAEGMLSHLKSDDAGFHPILENSSSD
jgi:carbonic anhydrase